MSDTDKEVVEYFKSLGYEVGWDFSARNGVVWHELYKNGKLVVQIDKGAPLKDIKEDFCCFHLGKPGTSASDFTVSGSGPLVDELFKIVYEKTQQETK